MANTKKEGNKKYFIVVLIVLLLALAVGYAAFSDTLTISGTANASGSFDVQFDSASVVKKVGVDEVNTTATISADKNTLTVVCKDLAYQGAGAQFHAVIKNVGTIPAKITSVTPTNITGNGNAIKISGLEAITTSHPTLPAQGTCAIDFTVVWDPDVAALNTTYDGEGGATADCSFELEIKYEQDTTAFNGITNHIDG